MENLNQSIQFPPQGSRISVEQSNGTIIISGRSQGIPREAYSSKAIKTIEKIIGIKEKLTRDSSVGLAEHLAKQVFEWSIEVSSHRVIFASSAGPDDFHFTTRDIRRIYLSAEGCHMMELEHLEEGKYKTLALTGVLSAEENLWLQQSLVQLFDLDPSGVAKPQVQAQAKPLSTSNNSFKLTEQAGGSHVVIQHVLSKRSRILSFVIGSIALGIGWLVLLSTKDNNSGMIPSLMKLLADYPFWSKVLQYLIMGGIIYAIFNVFKDTFGTMKMKIDKNTFEIKKAVFGLGYTRSMSRREMKELEQTTWIESKRVSDGGSLHSTQYWRLELKGKKSLKLFSKEMEIDDIDWLGHYLSDWYGIPYVKKM